MYRGFFLPVMLARTTLTVTTFVDIVVLPPRPSPISTIDTRVLEADNTSESLHDHIPWLLLGWNR